jgi:hypothetical protein
MFSPGFGDSITAGVVSIEIKSVVLRVVEVLVLHFEDRALRRRARSVLDNWDYYR